MGPVAESGLEERWPRLKGLLARRWPALLLAFILLAALGLRLYGINWDQGNFFQPDERSIYMRVMELEWPSSFGEFLSRESPLNPHWFPLGSILLYALFLIKGALSPIVHMEMQDLALAGRSLTILADVASVYMLFLLGRKLYGRKVGLLAAGLFALTATAIQHSHFYRPEPFIVLFVLVSFWFMLRVVERGSLKDSALLGLFVGLTFAVKLSVLPLLVPLAIGFGVHLFRTPQGTMGRPPWSKMRRVALEASVAALVAAALFLVSEPYALIDFPTLLENLSYETRVAREAGDMPYTVQYIGTIRYWYELQQTTVWGMGLPLGVVAWGGLLFTLLRMRRLSLGEVLVLAWVVPNFLLVGSFEVKFIRYMFPIIPFLVLMGSNLMLRTVARVKDWRPSLKPWAAGAAALIVLSTAFYALAFESIYARPHSAVQASEWINENIPQGSRILLDNHWDEGMPNLGRYNQEQIPMFEGDTPAKMEDVAEMLARGDYLVFYGKLTYGSIARMPERFPTSSEYYRALFAGELGYEPLKAFASYPELLEVGFVDDTFTRAGLSEPAAFQECRSAALSLNLGYADNDVVKYDHPKPLVFENTGRLSAEELLQCLSSTPDEEQRTQGPLMPPQELEAQQEGGTWSEIVHPSAWANRVPVLSWLLLVEVISLSALPLAFFVFRRLPDRGILWAKPLGILGVSYAAWLLASLKLVAFSRFSVLTGLLVLGFLSGVALRFRWREFIGFLKARWRLVLLGEALFLAAFLSFVAIRMANPDLWHPFRGGEKPMEFAYLNAVLKSTYMPPYDPWFAGGHINYYYFGYFIVAGLTKALGMLPEVAYNLAVPLFFALTVTGAFSLVYNVTEGLRRAGARSPILAAPRGTATEVEPPPSTPLSIHISAGRERAGAPPRGGVPWGPVAAGLAAAAFVAVLGNLDGIVQLLQGAWETLAMHRSFPAFDFWRSSRMIPDLDSLSPSLFRFWIPSSAASPNEVGPHITEFPFFTFLFADLHAHLMAMPFALLALGLLLALLLELRDGRPRRLLLLVVAVGLTLGVLAPINTWDYPPYIVLTVAVVACGAWLREGRPITRWGAFLVAGGGAVLLSFLAFLPFHLQNETPGVGIEASKWATPVYSYLGMFGLFVFVTGIFLANRRRSLRRALSGSRALPLAVLIAILAVVWLAVAGYWTAVLVGALLVPAALLLFNALKRRGEGHAVFPLLLLCMALLVSGGVEFVHMKPDIGRMNTLFKLYLEAWLFFAVASACALWYLLSHIKRPAGLGGRLRRGLWLGLVALLIGSSLIYTVLGTRSRIGDRFNILPLTLDGTAYMEEATYWQRGTPIELKWDLEAIEWLEGNVEGSPVVLEGHVPQQYEWGSRISIYTGLPTILGWHWHQVQQRPEYAYAVDGRQAIVKEIYSTTSHSRALNLLEAYGVEYIVVGELERVLYPEEGLAKFEAMVGKELELAYENEQTKIYRIIRAGF
jgi:YYY domain-containing protein